MYEEMTYESILERMLDRVPDIFDKREGSVIWDTHSPTAVELQILYIELDTILQNSYGDTAAREFLVKRCKERGIIPYEAANAVLKGEFLPADIDVLGQRFSINDLNYVVREKIADGLYKVQCETAGIIGNQYLGQLIPIDYIEGLETAELKEVLIPGEDEEDTEELRSRYLISFNEKAFGGNRKDYLGKLSSLPGVGPAKITAIWNGDIRPADMLPNARVREWYENTVNSLNSDAASWLTAVYTAASEKKLTVGGTVLLTILNSEYDIASVTLITEVQRTFDPVEFGGEGYGLAPIGHMVSVRSADAKEVAVRTNLVFEEGFGWSNLQSTVENVIKDYLRELRKGWGDSAFLVVRISQMETRLLGIDGVVDIAGMTLNGLAENLTLGEYEVPVFGGVSQ